MIKVDVSETLIEEFPETITIGNLSFKLDEISTKSGRPWNRTRLVLFTKCDKAFYNNG